MWFDISPKRIFIIILYLVFVGCVFLFLNSEFTREGLDEIPIVNNDRPLDIVRDKVTNQPPYGYYPLGDPATATKMAIIPYGYKYDYIKKELVQTTQLEQNKLNRLAETGGPGIATYNPPEIPTPSPVDIPYGNGTITDRVPSGYYLLDQKVYPNKMAVIPVGYTVSDDKMTLQPFDTSYKKLTDKTPDYHDSEAALIAKAELSDVQNGVAWVKDMCGNLVALPKSSVQGDLLYYTPGSYPFGPSNYVPKYEDSVFLSRLTGSSMTTPVYNAASIQGGFCTQYKNDPLKLEELCRMTNVNTCGSTNCCVLLGGSKCVAGDQMGPTLKSNYGDLFVRNKDFYYYQGKCFGNCQ